MLTWDTGKRDQANVLGNYAAEDYGFKSRAAYFFVDDAAFVTSVDARARLPNQPWRYNDGA
jgi:hypothetical protein